MKGVKKKKMKNTLTLLFVLITDQATKYIAVENMNWQANDGISFGIFPNFPLWVLVTLIIIMFLFMILQRIKLDFAWSLFIAGMSGNLIDRIRFSYVIDWIFVPVPFINRLYINIADIALIIGFICFVYNYLVKPSLKPD